jgi:hypothetical protein
MIEVFSGAGIGFGVGFTLGLITAVKSRDGIWPEVWAGMMIFWTSVGFSVGFIIWAFS